MDKPKDYYRLLDRPVVVQAVDEQLSTDGGLIPIRQFDERLGYTAGFAAPEQYKFEPGSLGPWSDIYSVGATLYTCIAGTPPQAADAGLEKDRLIPLRTIARQQYSDELYSIVDACLRLDHLERPQTAFELQKLPMIEPVDPRRKGFFDTLNKPLSKFFTK